MTIKVEALRGFANWQEVDFGPVPFKIKTGISGEAKSHLITENLDGTSSVVYTLTPLEIETPGATVMVGGRLYDMLVDELGPGESKLVEGIVPGNIKSEQLKITES